MRLHNIVLILPYYIIKTTTFQSKLIQNKEKSLEEYFQGEPQNQAYWSDIIKVQCQSCRKREEEGQ